MKTKNVYLICCLLAFAVLAGIWSCNKKNIERDSVQKAPPQSDPSIRVRVNSTADHPCGGSFSGSWSTLNSSHTYYEPIDVSCALNGATISVWIYAQDVPNRFYIIDQNGSTVASTGWLGNSYIGPSNSTPPYYRASYSGPWGAGVSNTGTTYLTFAKDSTKSYTLRVETVTPPNSNYSPNTDSWSVEVGCTCAGSTIIQDTIIATQTDACGNNYSGSFGTPNEFHTYLYYLDFSNSTKLNITVSVDALDIPNRFTIVDENGNFITGTGWLGNSNVGPSGATYSGPWGSSVSNAGTQFFTFTRSLSHTYYLRVETLTPPNTTSYHPNTDSWSAVVGCED